MACNSFTAGHRAKWSEIWDSVTLVTHILGTFDLVGFKVILGSFGALASKWPVYISKTASHRMKQCNLGLVDTSNTSIWGTFDLVGSRSFWGHAVHFPQHRF